ncbi:MAG: class I SAM-dependent methyltransferase [Betaproteobacteria bacterium]|nr:class I SAM-dependent methyltransferase [Betaproteobacteria bacterium]
MEKPGPVAFFGEQFDRQIGAGEYALNPFERQALPHMKGNVLDLGCGLGNLAFAAAKQGARVTALDACGNAVDDLARRAIESDLPVWVRQADLEGWRPEEQWDAVACIGLLMFFERRHALRGLDAVHDAVGPGGVAIVNVLVEGTTFMKMFDGDNYHLFTRKELLDTFEGWQVLEEREDWFDAPENTVKRFRTVIARRPG